MGQVLDLVERHKYIHLLHLVDRTTTSIKQFQVKTLHDESIRSVLQKTTFGTGENTISRTTSSGERAEEERVLLKKRNRHIHGRCASNESETLQTQNKLGRVVFQTKDFEGICFSDDCRG